MRGNNTQGCGYNVNEIYYLSRMETNTVLLLMLIAFLFVFVMVAIIILQRLHRDDKYYDDRWRIFQKEERTGC